MIHPIVVLIMSVISLSYRKWLSDSQLVVICTARVKCILINTWCQKEMCENMERGKHEQYDYVMRAMIIMCSAY